MVLAATTETQANPKVIKTSIYHFPPFFIVEKNHPRIGLGLDLISAMNDVQSEYKFETVETSPRRRHDMFQKGLYDVSLFDHVNWGWSSENVETTNIYLKGGERYISSNSTQKKTDFFQDISSKKIGAILGYHYRFAKFETDPQKLNKRFDINLVTNQEQIIKQVLANRIEIGVVTETFLKKYLRENRENADRIVISKNYDQEYNFVGIVRKNASISALTLEKIIYAVTTSPKYKWIADKYGIHWHH
ncbi:substrate-binding periplasmic protein [Kiloniella spongiae]|nr:transporter substrate-binding domain-containing protein [Kiloniella spongiae]